MYWVKTEELRFDWVDNYAAQNLISCKYFQIYFRYIASQWGGWHILHDDEMTAGFDDNIALSFWFHTFLAPNTMHCLSAMKGIFLFVWFFHFLSFSNIWRELQLTFPLWRNISCFLPKLWTAGSQLKYFRYIAFQWGVGCKSSELMDPG